MGSYDVYGNVGALQSMSDDQSAYHAKFQAIMQAIDADAKTVIGKWEGAGQQVFTHRSDLYSQHYQSVQGAFTQLITATDTASTNYAKLTTVLTATFG